MSRAACVGITPHADKTEKRIRQGSLTAPLHAKLRKDMAKIKIAKGNAFVYSLPLVELNADGTKENVQAADVQGLQVICARACGTSIEPEFTSDGNRLYISFAADLQVAEYNLTVTGSLHAVQDFALQMQAAFEIVQWDSQSNWRDYIIGDAIVPEDTPLIAGVFNSDEEWERLKEELRLQIAAAQAAEAAAQAAKREWEQKAAELDDVAQEATLTQGVQDIRTDIANIDVDTSDLAKQGTNPDATNTAILSYMSNIWEKRNDWNGFEFEEGFQPQSVFDLFANRAKVIAITDDVWEGVVPDISTNFVFDIFTNLRKYVLKKVTGFASRRWQLAPDNNRKITWIEVTRLKSITSLYSGISLGCQVGIFDEYDGDVSLLIYESRTSLIILRIGAAFTGSKNLANWRPAYDMQANTINPLNDSYATNGERLNASLRDNIAALLPNGGGAYTLTFSQVLRNVMTEETEQAFAAKGWNLAPAKSA